MRFSSSTKQFWTTPGISTPSKGVDPRSTSRLFHISRFACPILTFQYKGVLYATSYYSWITSSQTSWTYRRDGGERETLSLSLPPQHTHTHTLLLLQSMQRNRINLVPRMQRFSSSWDKAHVVSKAGKKAHGECHVLPTAEWCCFSEKRNARDHVTITWPNGI